jgi:thioredoxin-like negative regulator of GroEL
VRIRPENRFWIGIYGFTAVVMLVAMGVFGWLAWTSHAEPGVGRVAGSRLASVAASSLPDEQYELLARFLPPHYTPLPKAPKAFQSAMALYNAEDYAAAASALRVVSDAHPEFAAAKFYLGISLLIAGNRISGIQELRALTEAGDSSYVEPARFYLAKALIGEHDLQRAQEQLRSVIEKHGGLQKQAAALLAQIEPS